MVDSLVQQYVRLIALALHLGATESDIEPAKAALRDMGTTAQDIDDAISDAMGHIRQ